MSFDDLVNKAKDALNSEQGEQISDQVITGASDAADKVTGGKFADQVDGAQQAADDFLGQQAAPGDQTPKQ